MKQPLRFLTFFLFMASAMAQSNEKYLVSSQTLNLRSGAGKEYDIITTLSKGDAVYLLEKLDNAWWHVTVDDKEGYVFSEMLRLDPYSGWEKTNYRSGATPECENVSPKYDYSMDNYLRINIGSRTDVVVKLMKTNYYGDECIRIVYVRSGDSYTMEHIPEGRYYLKIAYGKDYRQKIVDNRCEVKFMQHAQYEKGSDILDFNKVKGPNEVRGSSIYETWREPSFELSLDVVFDDKKTPTFSSDDISEAEFNK